MKTKIFIAIMVFLMLSGVIAQTTDFSEEIQKIIQKVAGQKGIKSEDITDVKKVDFNSLPGEVEIEGIDETGLEIYEIQSQTNDPVFVITASSEPAEKRIASRARTFLNFGYQGEMAAPGFLKTTTGVESELNKGYVMMRPGSITGLSTSLDVTSESSNNVEIIIYKNGQQIGFGNTITGTGSEKDYDIQSEGVVTFEAGDSISIYASYNEGTKLKNVITTLEITVDN